MKRRTKVAAIVPTLAALTVTGIAGAAWLSSASGALIAPALRAQNSVIATVSAVALYPGASRTALVSVTNPNPFPVVVTGIASGASVAQVIADLGTCSAGSVTSAAVAPVGSAVGILQSDGTTMTIAASASANYELTTHMVANSDNACQGLEFTLPLTATLASNA